MEYKLLRPQKNIIHLKFAHQKDLTRTMLRFQEHFESPKFRNKIFSLEEFKVWYASTRENKKFTYYSDWSGFNFPSKTLKLFYDGSFDPLTQEEKAILDLLRDEVGKFYLIATFQKEDVKHEMGHALFHVSPKYRKEAKRIVATLDTKPLFKRLKEKGYNKVVWIDEVQAYLLDPEQYFMDEFGVDMDGYKEARKQLAELYRKMT